MNLTIPITFISPCFCRGMDSSDEGTPEIRPPSIRGQLHWWFRALGYSHAEECEIFGSIHKKDMASSPLVVRVSHDEELHPRKFPTLPHKSGGPSAPKMALIPGTSFKLIILTRLKGLSQDQEKAFRQTLDAWLYMGTLGLRATRGAGSISWEGQPTELRDWEQNLVNIIQGSSLRAAILDSSYQSSEDARHVISDTIGGRDDNKNKFPLEKIKFPLGTIKPKRKTSPLRFRIIRLGDNTYRILAVWDGRFGVTENSPDHLNKVIQLLCDSGKKIGHPLSRAHWIPA